jgi:CheY-like chemotaxis protein
VGGPLIFLVDDNLGFAESSGAVLRGAGFRLQTFLNPNMALYDFTHARKKPDLLIADYGMAYMNGLELIQRCQNLCPTLKTILVSGSLDETTIHQFPFKVDAFLAKPVTVDALLSAVNGVI